MVRVLHIFHEMANGGIENFVMNYYRFIDREKVQFDFLTSVDEPGYFDEEIKSLGGRIYHAFPKKNPIKNYQSIASIVKEQKFSIVHRHTGSAIANFDLLAAKHGGASTLIAHSHATQAGRKWLHYLARSLCKVDAVEYACSEDAGKWLFGEKDYEAGKVQIIKNAIDAKRFAFNSERRNEIRKIQGLKDEFVIGHVGNFNEAKNHSFIIDVFYEIQKNNPKAVLWLIGDGVLRKRIEEKVEKLNIKDKVIFWGIRKDVADIMQAMDVFIFPSLFEGFGIVALEAQCAGLRCFVSDGSVPKEIDIVGNTKFISLLTDTKEWAEIINDFFDAGEDRTIGYKRVKEAGFDIRDAAKDLERRYLSYVGK